MCVVSVCQWPRRLGFNPKLSYIPKTQKMVLGSSVFNTQHYIIGVD